MVSLGKSIFAIPPQIHQKMFSGEYERIGGVIRDKTSGRIACLLVDKLDEGNNVSSLSVSTPEIMGSTLKYLTGGQLRKYLDLVEKELDQQNIKIRPEDLVLLNDTINFIHVKSVTREVVQEADEKLRELYDRYFTVFTKYQKDLDRYKKLQSFPFAKILIMISVTAAKLHLQSGGLAEALHWVRRIHGDIVEAMKIYSLLNSKTEADSTHYMAISKYQPADFIKELKEIITSPPDKPKYKFPPMEVIYLWNCLEYLEGYLIELDKLY